MPARSCPEWERVGTDEPDRRFELGMASSSPVRAGQALAGLPIAAPAIFPPVAGEDPQPYNPNLQLQNGMTDWLNLKALGARGDGIADDTPIFQAANLLAAQPPGQLIYIPAGVYRLTANITFTAGVQWLMMGTLTGGFTLSGGTQIVFGSSGLTNVFAAAGDLLYSTGVNTPTRLPIGAANTVLTSVGGLPVWTAPVTGFADPTTTAGDMIFKNASAVTTRLPAGSVNQVLGLSGSPLVPTWINNPAGFTDPTTAKGDLIFKNAALVTTRLPIGSNGQQLQAVAGVPAWVSTATTVVSPSGDTTGVTDVAAIAAAANALPNGGTILLGPGDFYVTTSTTAIAGFTPPANTCIFLPQQTTAGTNGAGPISLASQGAAATIHVVGAGVTGVYAHRTASYGNQFGDQPGDPICGFIRDVHISGQNNAGTQTATGASVGLDTGDGWGLYVENVTVSDFAGTGAIGLNIVNRIFWTEKHHYWAVNLLNNSTQCYMTTKIPGADHSHEYNIYDLTIFCNQNQQGVISDGVNQGGSILFLKGNMCQTSAAVGNPPTGNCAALSLVNTTGQNNSESRWYAGQIWMKVEFNRTAFYPDGANGTNTPPYGLYSDGVGRGVQQCSGQILHSLSNSNLNGCEFSFFGPIGGDTNLSQAYPGAPGSQNTITTQPPVPASGVQQQNYGPNMQVFVTGGTGVAVSLNGIPTGLAGGSFYVCSGGTITLTYTGAPTWAWAPAGQQGF